MKSFKTKLIAALLFVLCLSCLTSSSSLATEVKTPGQVIALADDHTIVAALASNRIMIHSVTLLATSTTAVNVYLYNGDNMLLGNADNPLTLDKDGIDGPAGIVLPYNEVGWFQTDTAAEAVKLNMSASTPVIVLVNFSYLPF